MQYLPMCGHTPVKIAVLRAPPAERLVIAANQMELAAPHATQAARGGLPVAEVALGQHRAVGPYRRRGMLNEFVMHQRVCIDKTKYVAANGIRPAISRAA